MFLLRGGVPGANIGIAMFLPLGLLIATIYYLVKGMSNKGEESKISFAYAGGLFVAFIFTFFWIWLMIPTRH